MIKKYLLIGLFLRLLLMPFTGHWDLVALHTPAININSNGNIYEHYYTTYPPFAYWILHFWQRIVSPFTINLEGWLNLPVINSFNNPEAFRNLFLLKALYLPFDFLIAFLLLKIGNFQAFKMWLLNPIVLYIVYMWGSIDIIPASFMVLSAYLLMKKRFCLSSFFLGLGAAVKIFPIILFPLIFILAKNSKQRLLLTISAFTPILITFYPYLKNSDFYKNVLLNPSSQSLLYARIPIGSYQDISIYLVILTIFLLVLFKNKFLQGRVMLIYFFLIMLFYIFSAFTPQWFLWGLPFLIYFYSANEDIRTLIKMLVIIYLTLILFLDISLNFGIISPLETSILAWPSFAQKINAIFNVNILLGMVRSVFGGISIYLLYKLMRSYGKI